MFEDSLIESGNKLKTKRGMTTIISFFFQVMLIGVLVLLPLMFTEALPKTQLMTFLVAPPPPPPPPPPPAAAPVKVVKADPDGHRQRPAAYPHQDSRESPDDQGRRGASAGFFDGWSRGWRSGRRVEQWVA